ncbi:MAG TPA: hypothetical protein VGB29_06275 [Thermodesulfobacteriota bacterium]
MRGLCGFFYHDLFPSYPWSSADELMLAYPDRGNAVTIKLAKV